MNNLLRCAALALALLMAAVPAFADKAKSLYNQGRDAEARQDYETAYANYQQAWQLKPKDLTYRAAATRTRFLAGAAHVKRGQVLRENGKLEEALAEFQKAAEIDPASFIAEQEIRRTRTMIEAAKSSAAAPPKPTSELGRRIEQAPGPIELAPISNVPITLKLTEDSKVIYDTIGKLAGINVLFDPDYTSRRIHVELNGVTLRQALYLVALESKTFWRPVTSNTIFVAADTPSKRKELQQNVLKTFYLSNLSQPTELQDVVNTMRTILEVSRITQVPSQGAIVVRGTPDQIALAEKLIGDLDKAKPEVIVEVAVMQIRRDKLRDLGIQWPQTATVALNSNLPTTGTSTTGTSTTTTSTNTINLNRIGNLTAKDFNVTIPPATVNFLFTDSSTKIIQNPEIRALDGQKATLKIGDRVPVATGSFQPGIGGVGINPLVNTQFQYLDVGVNIDITPRIHAAREVTLKIALDVSSVTSHVNIGGIDQPVIGQRKIEHEIRLKEGEVNLMGGILEDQDIKALNGWPFFSQIPILKYFVSSEHTEKHQNEIVFALIPHIVRGQELTSLNLRPLDIGTATSIYLEPSAAPAPPQAPAPAPPQPAPTPGVTPPPPSPQPPTGGPAAPGAAPVPGAAPSATANVPVSLSFSPTELNQTVGSTFTVDINISGAQNIYSVPLQLQYDPKVLELLNVTNGGFLAQGGLPVALVHRDDPVTGVMQLTATRPPNSGGASGEGSVFTLTFMAKSPGESTVAITRAGVRDANMRTVPASGMQAVVNVRPKK
ncbi:MAG: cohesin domain-containing protein [Terriglobales bacterium]